MGFPRGSAEFKMRLGYCGAVDRNASLPKISLRTELYIINENRHFLAAALTQTPDSYEIRAASLTSSDAEIGLTDFHGKLFRRTSSTSSRLAQTFSHIPEIEEIADPFI